MFQRLMLHGDTIAWETRTKRTSPLLQQRGHENRENGSAPGSRLRVGLCSYEVGCGTFVATATSSSASHEACAMSLANLASVASHLRAVVGLEHWTNPSLITKPKSLSEVDTSSEEASTFPTM
jgi:hypothetical protein